MRNIDSLDQLKIASPCPARWSQMKGDDRKRFCDLCQLNVYSVAGLTTEEALKLVRESEGRLCMRLARRADGTLVTKDCPVGKQAVHRRIAYACVLGLATMMSGIAAAAAIKKGDEPTVFKNKCEEIKWEILQREPFASWAPQPSVRLGRVATHP